MTPTGKSSNSRQTRTRRILGGGVDAGDLPNRGRRGGLEGVVELHKKYQPRSMARAIRLVGLVMNPPEIAELKDVEAGLDKWEENTKILEKGLDEEFSDTVQSGIATSIMPASTRDIICQKVGEKVVLNDMMQKIRPIVSSKVPMMSGPCLMDVGKVERTNGGGSEETSGFG